MGYRLLYVAKRADSRLHQFRMRTPRNVLAKARGRHVLIAFDGANLTPAHEVRAKIGEEIKFSLGTTDDAVAKVRKAYAQAAIERFLSAIEAGPRQLAFKHIVALSGSVYRLWVDMHSDNPGTADGWAAFKALNRAAMEGRIITAPALSPGGRTGSEEAKTLFGPELTAGVNALPRSDSTAALEARFGIVADWILAREGFDLDQPTRQMLLRQIGEASQDAGWHLKQNAAGDYSTYPRANRFPQIDRANRVSISDLFGRWQRETQPAAATVSTWRGNADQFALFLGEKASDIRSVTTEDVIGWKDELVEEGLTAATINLGKLAAMKALFNFAKSNRLISENPVADVRIIAKRRAGGTRQPYTDDEVARLLAMAERETSPARRWLPLLAASSGARIGELTQLWGRRVREIEGIPAIILAPAEDGGSLKNEGSERTVPLHPAVVNAGFLAFAAAKGDGPLFYGRTSGREGSRHASKGTSNHLATWIRASGFADERKAPNHALRHWFKSAAVRAGVSDSVADAVQGHVTPGEASRYRHIDLRTLERAVSAIRLPS